MACNVGSEVDRGYRRLGKSWIEMDHPRDRGKWYKAVSGLKGKSCRRGACVAKNKTVIVFGVVACVSLLKLLRAGDSCLDSVAKALKYNALFNETHITWTWTMDRLRCGVPCYI